MTFTKEWLQHQIAEFESCAERTDGYRLDEGGKNTLSALKLALAGMEAEPVAWLLSGGGAKNHVSFDSSSAYADPLRDVTPLYAAPQLRQPVEPEITSEELDDELLEQLIDFRRGTLDYHKKEGNKVQAIMHGVLLRAMLELQERRSAMLQGKADGNSPVIQDGWVMVPVEPTDAMVEAMYKHQLSMRGALKAAIAAAPQQEAE